MTVQSPSSPRLSTIHTQLLPGHRDLVARHYTDKHRRKSPQHSLFNHSHSPWLSWMALDSEEYSSGYNICYHLAIVFGWSPLGDAI